MADLTRLLDNTVARAALARHDIAAVYRILSAAGVTQTRIAKATGQRQSEVSAVLRGRQVTSAAVLERIADGLGVPRGWLGLAHAPGLLPQVEEVQTEEDRNTNLFQHAATVLYGAPIFGAARPIAVEPAATPVPNRIGPGDVAWLVETTTRLDQLSVTLGGIGTSESLTAHATAAEALLTAEMSEPVRHALLRAMAELHGSAGWAAADAGLRDRARQHYARAMSCAGAADDRLGVIVNLHSEGRVELQFGEPNEALKILQLGVGAAPTELSRALLEYDCAWALARLGLADEAEASLRRARDAQQRAADQRRPWMFIAETLPHVEGCTQLALGRFDLAVAALATAADGADHAVRCSTLNRTEMATAQIRCGDLRAGLQTAATVINQTRTLRSVWVRERLAPLQQAAAARRDSACRDLAHDLAALRSAA